MDDQLEKSAMEMNTMLDEMVEKKDQLAANTSEEDTEAQKELLEITEELNTIGNLLTTMETDDDENPMDDTEYLENRVSKINGRLDILLQAIQSDSEVTI